MPSGLSPTGNRAAAFAGGVAVRVTVASGVPSSPPPERTTAATAATTTTASTTIGAMKGRQRGGEGWRIGAVTGVSRVGAEMRQPAVGSGGGDWTGGGSGGGGGGVGVAAAGGGCGVGVGVAATGG